MSSLEPCRDNEIHEACREMPSLWEKQGTDGDGPPSNSHGDVGFFHASSANAVEVGVSVGVPVAALAAPNHGFALCSSGGRGCSEGALLCFESIRRTREAPERSEI